MPHHDKSGTTLKQAEAWETATPLLEAMFEEFRELSKKKPEAAVGKAKIAVVNRLLAKCREALEGEPAFPFLDLLEEDNMPQNSDVILMLSQYVAAMNAFRSKYWYDEEGEEDWAVRDGRR